jgi:hypothetical protein
VQAVSRNKRKAVSSSSPAPPATADGSPTAQERIKFQPDRALASVGSALLEAGASPAEVTSCMSALPQTAPQATPVPASLLAAFAAYFVLAATLGLGISSTVFVMVGLMPLVAGVPCVAACVYLMHFPVDEKHMMGAGSGIVWRMKTLTARFTGSDNKIIDKVCCTGYFLLLLLEHLPFTSLFISDIHPFVNTARGGGYHSTDTDHREALLAMVNLWLTNGAVVFRVASKTAVLGVLDTLTSLMISSSKHFDVLVDVGGHLVRLHVFTSIQRSDSSTTPVFVIGSQHLSMFRFPWVGLSIIYSEVRANLGLLQISLFTHLMFV